MGFSLTRLRKKMENNDLFYVDTTGIPWYNLNKIINSTIDIHDLSSQEDQQQPAMRAGSEPNNIDDSVIFISETNANEDSHPRASVSAKKEVKAKYCNSSADKEQILSAKIEKKHKNKKIKKKTCKKIIFENIVDDSEIIVLDETNNYQPVEEQQQEQQQQTPHRDQSIDDSVIFVSETNMKEDFIPLSTATSNRKFKKTLLLSAKKQLTQEKFKSRLSALLKSNNSRSSQILKKKKWTELRNSVTKKAKPTIKVLETPAPINNITSKEPVKTVQPSEKICVKRMVLIDGSNVAYKHSNDKFFSVEGLKICLEYFEQKGYDVKAVVPQFRFKKSKTNNSTLLEHLKDQGKIIITPSKHLPGNFSCSYDDRCIIQMACEMDAAIVSNDNYCDLIEENEDFKRVIENRVIGYYWCNDLFMLPQDPYGRKGPTLNDILCR